MATAVALLMCSNIFIQVIPIVKGTTHWVVTEDGRVQAQLDSVFNLQRPYDLVAVLQQEDRARMLENLKQELLTKKEQIDGSEDKNTALEQHFYRTDPDCQAARIPLPEYDLYISTVIPLENKGIRPEDYIDTKSTLSSTPAVPDCTQVIQLDFSFHAFEHLQGVQERWNLSWTPEKGLKNAITRDASVDDYGHLVHDALHQNNTSWVLYNMAAFYWRIKGVPYHVIECVRRALHFSPRMQKDVALVSLANVLHRSHYSNEAAIVMHAALDVSHDLNVNHFTLGNIYAVLAKYNKSVICFENTLKIQPGFKAATDLRHAVLCHAKLEAALEVQHRSLQRTLEELRHYQRRHKYWQQQQEKLITEQTPLAVKMEQILAYESHKSRQEQANHDEQCYMQNKHGREVLDCTWRKPVSPIDEDFMASWEPKKNIDEPASNVAVDGQPVDYTRPVRNALFQQLNPDTPEELGPLPYKQPGWPQKEECDTHVHKFPIWNEFPTTYLPPENKGFEVRALLSEAQGRKKGDEHPLPWYPPVCVTLADIPEGPRSYDHIPSMKERTKIPLRLIDHSMRQTLLDMVEKKDITEEEVGQRILTALRQKIAPSWILYNLAGLYWRILGNNYHGIECIRRSLYFAPDTYKDVPLVNLANILYKWGRVDDAITVMRDAIAVNPLEPDTHFFLGNLLAAKHNLTGAVEHFELALRQSPIHKDAFSMLRVTRCYQMYHQSAQSQALETSSAKAKCGNNKRSADSHIICKQKKGKESCVVETQSQVCKTCKQVCAVSPLSGGSCASGKADGVAGLLKKIDGKPVIVAEDQCDGPGTFKSLSDTVGSNLLLDPNLSSKLDDISERYRAAGVCSGEDCRRLMIELRPGQFHFKCDTPVRELATGQIRMVSHRKLLYKQPPTLAELESCMLTQHYQPHSRLEVVDGNLHQKLIFVESAANINVGVDECIIYNTGERSPGCSHEQFKPFDLDVFMKHLNQPLRNNKSGNHGNDDDKSVTPSDAVATEADDTGEASPAIDDSNVDIEIILPDYPRSRPNTKSAKFSDVDIVNLSPDPARHILIRTAHEVLTYDKCVDLRMATKTDLSDHWVSVTTVGVKLSEHIDFSEDLGTNMRKPVCSATESLGVPALDLIDSVRDASSLNYEPETALEDKFCNIGPRAESIDAVATRIARTLEQDETSWVLAIEAALYWRVVGDAEKAITCLKIAYKHSPHSYVHVSLLSLVSLLLKAKQYDDALTVANIALEVAPYLTAVHYSVANVYMAQLDWIRARQFYESTLSLDPSFEMAKKRLWRIQCDIILSSVPVESLLQRPCM